MSPRRPRPEAKEKAIRRSLEAQRSELPADLAADAVLDVAVNSDGSVDGILRVRGLGHHDDLRKILRELEAGARARRVPATWMSVGVRFPGDERIKPENYAKWRGKLQAQAYFQQMTEGNVPLHFRRARKIVKWLREAGRRKPTEIFVRLSWNPDVKQPRIPASRRGKGRYKR